MPLDASGNYHAIDIFFYSRIAVKRGEGHQQRTGKDKDLGLMLAQSKKSCSI
jgi:hypothetical protein